MRMTIIFSSDAEIVLPVQYNHILQGFMYKNQLDRDYSKLLHQEGKEVCKGRFNLFTFSRLMGKFKFNKDTGKITLYPPAKLIISSVIDEFILDLADKLQKSELIFLGNNEVAIERIEMEECLQFGKKVQIKMLSPLVGCTTCMREEKKYTNYYSPWQSQFAEIARNNLLNKYEAVHGYRPDDKEIKIIPNGSQEKKFEKILNYRGTVVKGYAGIYWLKGCPELIKLAYEAGLGFKNNQGFGCWEVVKQAAV